MTTIGTATLAIIPSLRGVRAAIDAEVGNLSAKVDVDVSGAREAGRKAGSDVKQGLTEARIADGLHGQVEDELSTANAKSTGGKFGLGLASAIKAGIGDLAPAFSTAVSGSGTVLKNIAAIATGTKLASIAATGLSGVLLGAGTALTRLGGVNLGRLGVGLGVLSTGAGGAARDIGRLTASLIALTAVGRGLSILSTLGSIAAKGTIGLSALLGVATGVAAMLGGPMISALSALAAAMGVAAGAAAGILGPALLTLGLGFKGLQDAAKAYTSSDGGVSQAKAVASASKQVESAERAVSTAKRDSGNAEKDLTRARKDALQQIEDMNLALKGSALTEKDAQLSLMEAQRDLANFGTQGNEGDALDRERAILRVQEAQQRLDETQQSGSELADKAADANAKGVEGSDAVVAAKQRVADANQAEIDSQERLTEALQAQTEAQSAGQSGVDPFDLMIGQRMAPALDAVKGLKQGITDSLTTGLGPAFSTFGSLVDGMKPKITGLAGLFGGIGNDLTNALAGPVAKKGFDDMLAGSTTFFSAFKGNSGLAGLITGLVSFAGTAAKTFAGVGKTIDSVLGGIGTWLKNITPGQMTLAFDALKNVFTSIGNVVGPIFTTLKDLGGISAPALAPGFKAIGDAIKDSIPGLTSMARELMPALGQALKNMAPILPGIVDHFSPWATVIAVIAPVLGTLVSHLGPLAPLILGVAVAAKGIGAAMLVWNVAMTAVSIAQGIMVAATGADTAALGTNAIALAAHRVALLAGSAASGVMTAAQWLFNAALDANPIGLVVLAIAGLVAGLVIAYKNSETFRNIVNAAWTGIKDVVSAVWDWISVTLWPGIKAVFEGIGTAAMALWNDAIKPAWEGIKTAFSTAWDFVSGVFTKFKNGWDTLKNGVVGAASAIKDGVTTAFKGLADIIKAPLHALGGFLAEVPTDVLGIPVPGAATLQTWGKDLQGLSGGGYTGAMATDQVAGVVHGDEYVIKSTSRRRIENAYPGLMDFMNGNGALPMPGYADGGHVTSAALSQFASGVEGKPYVWGGVNWGDCSGAVSALVNFATGSSPFASRFATATESGELAKRGFKSGVGPAGSLNIGWFNGGPFGGHTAATLPDGTNFEMGGRRGNGQFGGGAAGASNSEFTDHAFLPPEFFTGAATPGVGAGIGLDGGAPTTGIASAADLAAGHPSAPGEAAAASKPGSSSGGGSLPSSFSDLSGFGFGALGSGVGKTNEGEDLSVFGKAVGTGVSGQVSSALGVLGVGDSPGWLQAATKLVGGFSVGGHDVSANGQLNGKSDGSLFSGANPLGSFGLTPGANASSGSASPLSATPTNTGVIPDAPHGASAGALPGPAGPTYNIRTATVEDAFLAAQRKQDEQSLSRLSRY